MKKETLYNRSAQYFRPYRIRYIFFTVFYALGMFLLFSSIGVLLKQIFTAAVSDPDSQVFTRTMIYLVLILAVSVLSGFAPVAYAKIEQGMQKQIRSEMIHAYLNAEERTAEKYNDDEVMNRIGSDLPELTGLFGQMMAGWVYVPMISGLVSLLYLLYVNLWIAVLCFIAAWIGYALTLLFLKQTAAENKICTESRSEVVHAMNENLYGAQEIRVFSLQEQMKQRLQKPLTQLIIHNRRYSRYGNMRSFVLYTFMECVSTIAILLTGGWLSEQGMIDFGDVMIAIPLLDQIWQMTTSFGTRKKLIREAEVHEQRIFEIMDLPARKEIAAEGEDIVLEHVTFSYNGKEDVVKDVTIRIPHGTKIAFVGESGSGKSTIAKLISGLYEPDSGTITGRDRSSLCYMPQEQTLMEVRTSENIALSRTPDLQKVLDAAEKAYADSFIREKAEGYDYIPVQNGYSGGQIQRISMARTLYKDADTIIMDEPTASLDPDSSEAIRRTIAEISNDHTVIVITHQLHLIRDFDCIVMMNKGKIEDYGTFVQLQNRCTDFKAMCLKQKLL